MCILLTVTMNYFWIHLIMIYNTKIKNIWLISSILMGTLNGEALLSTLHKFPSQQEVQYSTFVLAPISTQKFDFSGSQWLSHPLSIDHSLKLISTSPSCSFSGRYSTRCTFNTKNKCNKFVWILSEILIFETGLPRIRMQS